MTDTHPRTLVDLLDANERSRPGKCALLFGDERIDYATLARRSRQIASGLLESGADRGDRIAYIGANSAAYYEILFAAARIGAVMLPVNWRLADDELVHILTNGGARILFAEPRFIERLEKAGLSFALRVPLNQLGVHDDFAAWRDARIDDISNIPIAREDVVMQLYTSGTTGKPKGAMLSHRSILALRSEVPDERQPVWNRWTEADVSILPLPLFHIGTAAWGLIGMYYGATSIIQTEFDPLRFIDAIERHGVTRLCMVPSALKLMIEHPRAAGADFSTIRYTFYGASPIPLPLLRDAMRVVGGGFVQIYGMTETSGAISGLPPEAHDLSGNRRMLSAGKPFPGVEIQIRSPEGRALPEGKIGEVAINCGANMVGYYGDPAATARSIDADGWLLTGDAGYLEDGYLFIHDRIKEMIISGGENVYPAEVEAALCDHPDVADVAVIGVPDPKWGEAVKAVIVRSPQSTATSDDVLAWLKSRIAGYKVPKSIDFVDSLPRNAAGKVLRKDLREPYWAGMERRVN